MSLRHRSLFIAWQGGGGGARIFGGSVVTENPKGRITENIGRIQSGEHSNLPTWKMKTWGGS